MRLPTAALQVPLIVTQLAALLDASPARRERLDGVNALHFGGAALPKGVAIRPAARR